MTRSRPQIGQLDQIPAPKGKVQDLLLIDHRPHFGVVGVEDGRLSQDGYFLLDVPGLHHEIHPTYLRDLQAEVPGDVGLEAGQFCFCLVGTRF